MPTKFINKVFHPEIQLVKEGKGSKEEGAEAEGEYCLEEEKGGDTDITNTNDADLQTTAEIAADTGGNEANGNNGDVSIDTGNATATADVFNLVNTNVIDSNGLSVLLSNFGR